MRLIGSSGSGNALGAARSISSSDAEGSGCALVVTGETSSDVAGDDTGADSGTGVAAVSGKAGGATTFGSADSACAAVIYGAGVVFWLTGATVSVAKARWAASIASGNFLAAAEEIEKFDTFAQAALHHAPIAQHFGDNRSDFARTEVEAFVHLLDLVKNHRGMEVGI
jgi:hypothetical protein